MPKRFRSTLRALRTIAQVCALALICLAALAATASTALAAAGVLPWLTLEAGAGGAAWPGAGVAAQLGLTGLLVALCFFLPSNGRILALETSHRKFEMQMQDVARAYHAAHAADRAGTFRLSSEFDAVKERLAWLRGHPDLERLEPGVLELAAQMSHVSRELAETYSDEAVTRARDFLVQRQHEIDRFESRIEEATLIVNDLRRWQEAVELDEAGAQARLDRLRETLGEVLPEILAGPAAAATPRDNVQSFPPALHAAE